MNQLNHKTIFWCVSEFVPSYILVNNKFVLNKLTIVYHKSYWFCHSYESKCNMSTKRKIWLFHVRRKENWLKSMHWRYSILHKHSQKVTTLSDNWQDNYYAYFQQDRSQLQVFFNGLHPWQLSFWYGKKNNTIHKTQFHSHFLDENMWQIIDDEFCEVN